MTYPPFYQILIVVFRSRQKSPLCPATIGFAYYFCDNSIIFFPVTPCRLGQINFISYRSVVLIELKITSI